MRITLLDGSEKHLPFRQACHGYVAAKIEIEAADIAEMRLLAVREPEIFNVCMLQLEGRFESVRP